MHSSELGAEVPANVHTLIQYGRLRILFVHMQYIGEEEIDDKGPVLQMNNSCFPLSPSSRYQFTLHTQHIGSYILYDEGIVYKTVYEFSV